MCRCTIPSTTVRPSRQASRSGGRRAVRRHPRRLLRRVAGTVTGTEAGDEVEVWFSGRKRGAGQVTSEHFTYQVHDDIGGDGAHPRGRGRDGHQPRTARFHECEVCRRDGGGAHCGRAHQRRLRLRHPGPEGPASPRRAVTTTRCCGRPGTTSSCGRRGRWSGTTMRPRWTSSCRSATAHLDEAARRWSAASTRSSPGHRMVPTSTTRSPPGTHERLSVSAGAERLPAVLAGRLQLHRQWRHHRGWQHYPLTGIADPYNGWNHR